jgi:2'-5' RNA ligase
MSDLRLFIAIEIDDVARGLMDDIIRRLRDLPGKISWSRPQQIHLTLSFLGDTPPERIIDIGEAMRQAADGIAPFDFHLTGIGAFPDKGRPRVIWIGLDEPTGALIELQERLTIALLDVGFDPEQRPFKPHVTLGRVRRADRRTDHAAALTAAADEIDLSAGTQFADRIVLFSSELSRGEGPSYVEMADAPLVGQ